jgi:hypothetical protein
LEIQTVPLVAAFPVPLSPCDVRTGPTGFAIREPTFVDELATKGPERISRLSGGRHLIPPAPVVDVGVVVFRNGIQDRLGRRDRLQYGQARPAEIRPVCRLIADHCHRFDRRPPLLEINRG